MPMIGLSRDGNVLTIEMQRPERRNALNGALVDGVREAIEGASLADTRAIVLTSAGTVFSAGADLSDAEGVAKELPDKAIALNLAIDACPIPVIAALNGPAIGAGVIIAMICDLRVAVDSVYFQFPIAKYGLALDNWSIRRLVSLVGHGRARGMLIAAERLDLDTGRVEHHHDPRHAGRRAGLGRRDRRPRPAVHGALQARPQRRRRLRHRPRRAHPDVQQGLVQPGRAGGPDRPVREAPAEVPRRLTCWARRSGSSAAPRPS